MDNPYWHTEGRAHQVDLDSIKRLCLEVVSIIEASKPLAEDFKNAEAEEGEDPDLDDYPLLKMHLECGEEEISQRLLQLCLMVRTYDDIMSDSDKGEAYAAHAKETDGVDYVGVLEGGELNLREACNKVIHAKEIRGIYERADGTVVEADEERDQDVWYLTGEIELTGSYRGKPWEATLYTQNFVETVLDRITFKPD